METRHWGESPALFTVAQVGTWRSDGNTWGWLGENGWLYFRSKKSAEKFSESYQRLSAERRNAQQLAV